MKATSWRHGAPRALEIMHHQPLGVSSVSEARRKSGLALTPFIPDIPIETYHAPPPPKSPAPVTSQKVEHIGG